MPLERLFVPSVRSYSTTSTEDSLKEQPPHDVHSSPHVSISLSGGGTCDGTSASRLGYLADFCKSFQHLLRYNTALKSTSSNPLLCYHLSIEGDGVAAPPASLPIGGSAKGKEEMTCVVETGKEGNNTEVVSTKREVASSPDDALLQTQLSKENLIYDFSYSHYRDTTDFRVDSMIYGSESKMSEEELRIRRKRVRLEELVHGGSQERRRPHPVERLRLVRSLAAVVDPLRHLISLLECLDEPFESAENDRLAFKTVDHAERRLMERMREYVRIHGRVPTLPQHSKEVDAQVQKMTEEDERSIAGSLDMDGRGTSHFVARFLEAMAEGLQPLEDYVLPPEDIEEGKTSAREAKKEGKQMTWISASSLEPALIDLHTLATGREGTPLPISTSALAERIFCLTHRGVRLHVERAHGLLRQSLHAAHLLVEEERRSVGKAGEHESELCVYPPLDTMNFIGDLRGMTADYGIVPVCSTPSYNSSTSEETTRGTEGWIPAKINIPESAGGGIMLQVVEGDEEAIITHMKKQKEPSTSVEKFKSHLGMVALQQWLVEECMLLYQRLVTATNALTRLLRRKEEEGDIMGKESNEGGSVSHPKEGEQGKEVTSTNVISDAVALVAEEVEAAYVALIHFFHRLIHRHPHVMPSIIPFSPYAKLGQRNDEEIQKQQVKQAERRRKSPFASSLAVFPRPPPSPTLLNRCPWWACQVWCSPVFASPPFSFPEVRSCEWKPSLPHQLQVEIILTEWYRYGTTDEDRHPLPYAAMTLATMGEALFKAGWNVSPRGLSFSPPPSFTTSTSLIGGSSPLVFTTISHTGRTRRAVKNFQGDSSSSSAPLLPSVDPELSPLLHLTEKGRTLSILLRHLPENPTIESLEVQEIYTPFSPPVFPRSLPSCPEGKELSFFVEEAGLPHPVAKEKGFLTVEEEIGKGHDMVKVKKRFYAPGLRHTQTVLRVVLQSPHFSAPLVTWAATEAQQRSPSMSFASSPSVTSWNATASTTASALASSCRPPSSWGRAPRLHRSGTKMDLAGKRQSEGSGSSGNNHNKSMVVALAASTAIATAGHCVPFTTDSSGSSTSNSLSSMNPRASEDEHGRNSSFLVSSSFPLAERAIVPSYATTSAERMIRRLKKWGGFLVKEELLHRSGDPSSVWPSPVKHTLLPDGLTCPAVLPPLALPSTIPLEIKAGDHLRTKGSKKWTGIEMTMGEPPLVQEEGEESDFCIPPPPLHPLLQQTITSFGSSALLKAEDGKSSSLSPPFSFPEVTVAKEENENFPEMVEEKDLCAAFSFCDKEGEAVGSSFTLAATSLAQQLTEIKRNKSDQFNIFESSSSSQPLQERENEKLTTSSTCTGLVNATSPAVSELEEEGTKNHIRGEEGSGPSLFIQDPAVSLPSSDDSSFSSPFSLKDKEAWKNVSPPSFLAHHSTHPAIPQDTEEEEEGGETRSLREGLFSSLLHDVEGGREEANDEILLPRPYRFANGVTLHYLSGNAMVLQRRHKVKPWGLSIRCLECPEEFPELLPMRLVKLPPIRVVKKRGKLIPVVHPFLQVFTSYPSHNWYIDTVNGLAARHPHYTFPFMATLKEMVLKFKRF